MNNRGYTLIELLVALAIAAFLSYVCLLALISSSRATSMASAQTQVQGNLRTAMTEMSREVCAAFTQRLVDAGQAPEDAASIVVGEDGTWVAFQVPVPVATEEIVGASEQIVYQFVNEDQPGADGLGNALLDDGEDLNGDGVLTRQIIRIQGDAVTIVGLPNEISRVQFTLEENQSQVDSTLTTLHIVMEASKRYGNLSENEVIRGRLETRVHLEN